MKLSIITINYNDCSGLEKTIQSVLGQTRSDFQYIVIDGNSTDGSAQLLEKYKNVIDVGISEKDTGIYNAMNKGAKFAEGEYLLFLNSGDELFDNNVIENVYSELKDYDIISGCTIDYSDTESFLHVQPEHVSLYTFVGGSLSHPSSFIKRELFEKIGGYHEEYRIVSDWCFFIEAIILSKCTYRAIKNIIVRFNCFGISSAAGDVQDKERENYLNKYFGSRILDDYLPIEDEAVANTMYWISKQTGSFGVMLRFPFKVINRILKLRFRLGMRVYPIKQ
jgi:glycosyltransferase involved in cell wall biosynthesis